MKYPIYTQTVEYFGEGNNITEYRPAVHWFEAVYSEDYEHRGTNGDEQGTTKAGKGDKVKDDPTIQSGGD